MFKSTQSAPVKLAVESFRISIEDEALVGEIAEQAIEITDVSDSMDLVGTQAETLAGAIDILESKPEPTPQEIALTQSALDMMGAGADARAEDFGFAAEAFGSGADAGAILRSSIEKMKQFMLGLLAELKKLMRRLVESWIAIFSRIFTGVEYRKRHLAALLKRLDAVKTVSDSVSVVSIVSSLDNYIAAGRVAHSIADIHKEITSTTGVITGFSNTFSSLRETTITDLCKIVTDTTLDTVDTDIVKIGALAKAFQKGIIGTLGGARHTTNNDNGAKLYCSRYILGQKAIVLRCRDIDDLAAFDLSMIRGTRVAFMNSMEIEDRKVQVQPFEMKVGTHAEITRLVKLIDDMLDKFVVSAKNEYDTFLKKYQKQIDGCATHLESYIKTLKTGQQSDVNKKMQNDFSIMAQLPNTMLDWVTNPTTSISSHILGLAQTHAALAEKMVYDYEKRATKQKP